MNVPFVIGSYNGFEAFLARSIPNHGLDDGGANIKSFRAELHSEGCLVVLHEFVIDESAEQRTLSRVYCLEHCLLASPTIMYLKSK